MQTSSGGADFLSGGGEMAERIRAFDWTTTGMGPIADWPVSIKTTIGVLLRSPVPIVTLWGERGTMIYNDAYSEFAGGRHPELLGSAVREGWAEIADFNDNVMRVGLAGGTLSYEDQELTLHRSGRPEQVFMNLYYSPVIGEAGSPIGVIAVVVETTRSVQASKQLQENEERLRFLDELGRATASAVDPDEVMRITTKAVGEHLSVSNCAYADMEADQDHFTIRGDWSAPGSPSIVGHYSLADFGELAVANLSQGKPLVINDNLREIAPHEAATFQSIGIAATICMPLVKQDRLTALMAIHNKVPRKWTASELALLGEVTERSWAHIERVRSQAAQRRSERQFREELEAMVQERTAALAQSEKNIRTIFDTSHLYQGLLALDGTVLYFNDTALNGMGAARQDVLGRPLWDTPWFSDTPGMSDTIRLAVEEASRGQTASLPLTLKLAAGTRNFDFTLRPAFNEKGEVISLVPEAVDTTARVKTEQALQQAQKMEAIGNLTGGVAHDFNNLLMAVSGSLELLRKRVPEDENLYRLIDNAIQGARRGSSLTTRMLAFARQQELQTHQVDLSELISGLTELMERSLGPTVEIKTELPSGLPSVDTDANQLESAVLNLAVNARDAMNGTGEILIAAREEHIGPSDGELAPGTYVCLSVTDTGEGMDAATLKRATDPFFTTKGVGRGTGLGLSMVHGFVEQSGGKLQLKSYPGQGTTAEIWLPAFHGAKAAPLLTVSTPDEPVPASPSNAKLNILVVDDDALVLMNTVAMLEDLGHRVSEAYSGAEALKLYEQENFDLVVTDHAMPRMTGAQMAATIRAVRPAQPILLATGYADIPPGADATLPRLSKPFTQANLEDAVSRAMSADQTQRRTASR